MSKREKRNEHSVWVDVAKYFIDQFGMDVGIRILNLIVPEKAKAWLKDALSGVKGEALLGSIAIGAARIIPDSPFGEVLEEAIRELAASLKSFVGGKSSEDMAKDMPADIKEKIETARQAAELGYGLLSLQTENACAIAAWLSWLKKEKGDKAASKAFRMLNGLPSGYLETFSMLDLAQKNAYFEAFSFEEEKKAEAPNPRLPSLFKTWIDGQRAEMDGIIRTIADDTDRLRRENKELGKKLRAAWQKAAIRLHRSNR